MKLKFTQTTIGIGISFVAILLVFLLLLRSWEFVTGP